MGRIDPARRTQVGGLMADPKLRDVHAESALLGALLVRGEMLPEVRDTLTVRDFGGDANRIIYGLLLKLDEDGKPLDPGLLRQLADDAGPEQLEKLGGPAYLAELMEMAPRSDHAFYYAERVLEKSEYRTRLFKAEQLLEVLQKDGHTLELVEALKELVESFDVVQPCIPVDIHTVQAEAPDSTVSGLIPRAGLTVLWATPNSMKTYVLLAAVAQLTAEPMGTHLFKHPELAIRRGYKRVLWLGTEETTGRLRWRFDKVRTGFGGVQRGELLHLWAADPKRRVTLDDVGPLIERYNPDVVVVDPLTGLRPKQRNGQRIQWDLDNDAANDVCMTLRGLAASNDVDVILIHHSNKGGEEYRGPIEWLAACDSMLRLEMDKGRIKVTVQKARDCTKLPPFYLLSTWATDSLRIDYDGEAETSSRLTPTANLLLAYLRGRPGQRAPQYIIADQLGAARSTVLKAKDLLVKLELIRDTGETEKMSPIYELVAEVSGVSESSRTLTIVKDGDI